MQHGRDHDNRSVHVRSSRHNNTPDDPETEGLDVESSEPRELEALEERGPKGGSRPAPTRRAAEREAERHRLERERGRFAAGEGGLPNAIRLPSVTREELEEAAREADRKTSR